MNFINIKIAWRNIWRNKLRSSVVIMAISIGVFGGLASVGIMKGMISDMVNNALETETSHIQFHNKKYAENNEVQYIIKNTSEIISKLKQYPNVVAVTSRTKVTGMASTASKGVGIMLNGINPEIEKNVSTVNTMLIDTASRWLGTDKKNRIVISKKLSEKLNAGIKSKIILTFQDYEGNITGAAFKVIGIYKTQNGMFDEMNVFVNKKDINRILNLPENSSHEIAILLNNYKDAESFIPILSKQFKNLQIDGWYSINPYLKMSTDMTGFMLLIFMTIIMLALGFAIVNTMLMVILERKKELGMIMAIGMNRFKVFKMIMWETLLLSLTGAVIGIIISAVFTAYFGQNGIDISSVGEGFESVGYSSVMYPELGIADYIQVVILVFITGIIASIFPSIRALKMKPAEAVKE